MFILYTHMKAEISSPQAHLLQKQSQLEVHINFFFSGFLESQRLGFLKNRKKKRERKKK